MSLRKPPSEADIEALIEHGGGAARARGRRARPVMTKRLVQVRMSDRLLDRIDHQRGLRIVTPSRHAWILDAVQEKLARDQHKKE